MDFMPPDKHTIIPPADGWEDSTYYVVEASMSRLNPIHKYIFFSGFCTDGQPSGYNEIFGCSEKTTISDVHYLKVIRKIDMSDAS